MHYLRARRQRLPGDAELFPMIRTWIKECLAPKCPIMQASPLDEVFDDFKLASMRVYSPEGFARFSIKAREYHQKQEDENESPAD